MTPMRQLLAAAAALAWALAGCSRTPATAKLAVIAPLTGELAADGQGMARAVEMAVAEARESGALTRPVSVVAFDDRAKPSDAADAARRAAADPEVFAVIGPLTSGCAIEAARALASTPLPMITPSATAAELTLQQERPQWPGARVAFRLPPSDAVQGDFDAEYAVRRLSLARMAVIHDDTPYGLGLAEAFRRGYESRGGVVTFFLAISRGGDDSGAAALQLAAMKPDGVFYGGIYVEAGKLLKAARAAGFAGAFLSGTARRATTFSGSRATPRTEPTCPSAACRSSPCRPSPSSRSATAGAGPAPARAPSIITPSRPPASPCGPSPRPAATAGPRSTPSAPSRTRR